MSFDPNTINKTFESQYNSAKSVKQRWILGIIFIAGAIIGFIAGGILF